MTSSTTSEPRSGSEAELETAIRRLNSKAWGISLGLLFGVGLFAATIFLILKGGPHVGQHLELLSVYLPGYRVTVLGAFIGLLYGFILGYAGGRLIGTIYNRLVGPPAR